MGWGSMLIWLGVAVAGYLLLHLLAEPARYALLLAGRGALGYAALWLVNTLEPLTGLHLPLNPVTAMVAGVLGLPGAVAIYLLSRLYG